MTTETINNITIEQPVKIKDRLEIFELEDVQLSLSEKVLDLNPSGLDVRSNPKGLNLDLASQDVPSCSLTKRKRGRPKGSNITAPWRHKEDGTYCNKPSSKNYFNDYYRDHYRGKVNCPLCNREVVKVVLQRHQSSSLCKKRQVNNIV